MKLSQQWSSAAARRLLAAAGNPPSVPEAVRIIADRLLEGVCCPPTDLEAVARSLGVTSIVSESIPISGELRETPNGLQIAYSCDLSPSRRRFTIAHEIGHAFFESTGSRCPRVGEELERICDLIASEILMPSKQFSAYLGTIESAAQVYAASRVFQTSIAAVGRRIGELFKISSFMVNEGVIEWGYGLVRRGNLKLLDSDVIRVIDQALSGVQVDAAVFVNTPSWKGQCRASAHLLRNGASALFILVPLPRERRNR